ncbi:ester cyclase [Xanthobacter dioxanivorans]|uniref:Ester cyclase n=1 Tax=Xanthobacter dioxanivorans TaxID=2528964 RepID=A0A974SL34_9HYPH|nr:ester cyclase [Xanthobacter dioxanivorans]QRG08874.1 ester cyclase [Xanthobacter dioxanivorans]
MSPTEVRDFAQRLMREVWEPYDHTALARFYHPDMIGHHRAQTLTLDDVRSRLQWDVQNFGASSYDIRDIVADEDKFAIRFIFSCSLLKAGTAFRTEVTYFYHLRDGRISAFWLLSDTDFDYRQHPE